MSACSDGPRSSPGVGGIPGVAIRRLVERLAPVPCLGWHPGWVFADAEQRPTSEVRLRRSLWRAGRGLSVRLPWHDGLVVEVVLGTDSSRCLFVSGSYEPNELMLLAAVLRPGMNVVDVGANEGLYTTVAAKRVGAEGSVLALEPSPREHVRLMRNLALNQLTNVEVVEAAAAAESGTARLRVAEMAHGGTNTLGDFVHRTEQLTTVQVELVTLDGLLASRGNRRVDVLKIDVEGAEHAVLRGSSRLLQTHRPLVMFEVLGAALESQGADVARLLSLLRGHGYRLYRFGSRGRPEPLDSDAEPRSENLVACHPERHELAEVVERLAQPDGSGEPRRKAPEVPSALPTTGAVHEVRSLLAQRAMLGVAGGASPRQLCRTIYRRVAQAGTRRELISSPRVGPRILGSLSGRRGLWCEGFVHVLERVLQAQGLPTARLLMGVPHGDATHVALMCETDAGEALLLDPYFGLVVQDGVVTSVLRGDDARWVIFRDEAQASQSPYDWVFGGRHPPAGAGSRRGGLTRYRCQPTFEMYQSAYPGWREIARHLVAGGHPPDYRGLAQASYATAGDARVVARLAEVLGRGL